jgi:hypothetical protein
MKKKLDLYEIKSVVMLAATAKDMVFFFFFFALALLPLSQTGCATCLSILSEELLLLLGILFLDCEGSEFLSPMLLQQPTTGSNSLTSRECSPEEPPPFEICTFSLFLLWFMTSIHIIVTEHGH